jgi:hypothetical protein
MTPELIPSDKVILRVCGEMESEGGQSGASLDTDTVLEKAEREGVGREEAVESIQLLSEEGYIKAVYTTSEVPYRLTLTDMGFEEYGRGYIQDYEARVRAVEDQIANHDKRESTEIAEALDESLVFVERIFGLLEAKDDVELFYETGPLSIRKVNTRFKRRLRPS